MSKIIAKVYAGEDIKSISKKYKIPVQILKEYNGIENVCEGDRFVIPFRVRALHIVQPLETLEQIASKYHTTQEKICQDNQIIDKLFIGQQLLILET